MGTHTHAYACEHAQTYTRTHMRSYNYELTDHCFINFYQFFFYPIMCINIDYVFIYADKSSFDFRLIQFVTAVLQEMDLKNSKTKEWALEEALKHAQISGTFRNTLSQRLDKILLPILVQIIALIDKNFNLTIMHDNRDSIKKLSPIAKLWLEIFSERKLCKISYEEIFTTTDVVKTKKWVPRISASFSDHFYKCQFPFSWICQAVINFQKRDSAVLAGMQHMVFVLVSVSFYYRTIHCESCQKDDRAVGIITFSNYLEFMCAK